MEIETLKAMNEGIFLELLKRHFSRTAEDDGNHRLVRQHAGNRWFCRISGRHRLALLGRHAPARTPPATT